MIRHIVMWKMKAQAEGADAAANMELMRRKLLALGPIIPEIVEADCGPDFNRSGVAYDFGLVTVLRTNADLQIYQDHPTHVKVKEFIAKVTESRAVVDFASVE